MDATVAPMTVNEDHAPGNAEERVLRAFVREREEYGESRMNPALIRRRLDEAGDGTSKQNVNYALRQLTAAGWVRKLEQGLYEFVDDPRE